MKLAKFSKYLFYSVCGVIAVVLLTWITLDLLPLGDPSPHLTSPTDGSIIDMHVHVAGIGSGDSGCFISKQLQDSYKFGFYLQAFGVSKKQLLKEGDQVVFKVVSQKIAESKHVGKAIILAMDGVVDEFGNLNREKTEVYVPNELVATETAKYENLLFGASVNPYRKDALERLEVVKSQGALLVKWIPSIMLIDPADPALTPFYTKLVELNLPLLTHVGAEASFTHSVDELNDPKRLHLPLGLGVTIIAAHIATTGHSDGEDNFLRLLPMFEQYPNLYTDISSLTQINKLGYLAQALELGYLNDRFVYGSDWPLQFFPLVSPWYHIKHARLADLREASKAKNQWDRDILLKKAMGVPDATFKRSEQIFLSQSR